MLLWVVGVSTAAQAKKARSRSMVEFGTVGKALNDRGEGITVRQCQDQNCLGKLSIRSSSCCCAGGRHRMWSRRGLGRGRPASPRPVSYRSRSDAHLWPAFKTSPKQLDWQGPRVAACMGADFSLATSASREAVGNLARWDPNGAHTAMKCDDYVPKATACGPLPAWSVCDLRNKSQIFSPTTNNELKVDNKQNTGHQIGLMRPLGHGGRNEF